MGAWIETFTRTANILGFFTHIVQKFNRALNAPLRIFDGVASIPDSGLVWVVIDAVRELMATRSYNDRGSFSSATRFMLN